jgi:putative serine protease PepD
VTIQEVADAQRFCQRCGDALDCGRCRLHGDDVSTHARSPRNAAPTPEVAPVIEPWWQAQQAQEAPPALPLLPLPLLPPTLPTPLTSHRTWLGPVAAAVAVLLLFALVGDHIYLQQKIDANHAALRTVDERLSAQLAATNALAKRVGQLQGQTADPATVARVVLASVYTIETPDGLGSGWVVSSSGGSSTIITDYHVIQSVWTAAGAHTVQVKQNTTTLTGTITKVDAGDDLAAITVPAALTPLTPATSDALIGDEVFVVGSPLGLSGTVANGIVSAFRNGLIQFSAPISPGDSGGPVVNQLGRVIGVAESKLVGSGVEGLSFAIPISTVCNTVTTC